jgi:hypothetical protein
MAGGAARDVMVAQRAAIVQPDGRPGPFVPLASARVSAIAVDPNCASDGAILQGDTKLAGIGKI